MWARLKQKQNKLNIFSSLPFYPSIKPLNNFKIASFVSSPFWLLHLNIPFYLVMQVGWLSRLFNKLREWLVLVGFWSIWSIAKQSQANPPCLHTCDSCKDCLASRTISFFYRLAEKALILATHGARHQALSDHCRQAVATACSVTLRSLQEPRRHVCLPPAPGVEWPEPRCRRVTDLLK